MTLVANPSALTINRWGVRETRAGIITVNIPIIKPIFTKCFWSRNFSPNSDKGSTGRNAHGNGSDATDACARTRKAFCRRVEAYELNETFFHDGSQHAQNRKKFEGQPEMVEVDSNGDIQPVTNRSSEDLVLQIPSGQRRPSFAEQEEDLEIGPQSPGRVEVLVEQSYHSRRSLCRNHSASWAEERPGWNGMWPRNGYGNRVTIEARQGSQT